VRLTDAPNSATTIGVRGTGSRSPPMNQAQHRGQAGISQGSTRVGDGAMRAEVACGGKSGPARCRDYNQGRKSAGIGCQNQAAPLPQISTRVKRPKPNLDAVGDDENVAGFTDHSQANPLLFGAVRHQPGSAKGLGSSASSLRRAGSRGRAAGHRGGVG